MKRLINQFFTCPIFHHPLFYIVPDGVEIKCHWCKQKHFIGRSHFEQAWNDISKMETRPLQVVRMV